MTVAPLHLISSAGLYGAERVLLELCAYLAERGRAPHVGALASAAGGEAALLEAAGAFGLRTIRFPCRGAFDPAVPRLIREYVAAHDIGIVHSHGYKSDVYLRAARLPAGVARVATAHGWLTAGPKLKVYEWLDLRALRGFDHVAVVSAALLEKIRRAGVRNERSSIIANGIRPPRPVEDAEAARERERIGAAPGEPLIVRVGRLSAEKGNDLLLDALAIVFREVPGRLLFVGEGEEREMLEERSRKLGIAPRVSFAGYRGDVAPLLAACNLFVISSRSEGLPIVLLEAMAARAPIIATDVGAIREVLEDGRRGVLVPPGRSEALAEGILGALRDPGRMARLAAAARDRYENHYSQRAMGEQYARLYDRLRGGEG